MITARAHTHRAEHFKHGFCANGLKRRSFAGSGFGGDSAGQDLVMRCHEEAKHEEKEQERKVMETRKVVWL